VITDNVETLPLCLPAVIANSGEAAFYIGAAEADLNGTIPIIDSNKKINNTY
jgi:hypothetical protein